MDGMGFMLLQGGMMSFQREHGRSEYDDLQKVKWEGE